MASSQSYQISRTIHAPAGQVFYALTHEYATRQWLCDGAFMQQRADGRFFFNWNGGGTASGKFTQWEDDKLVELSWHSDDEPSPTTLRISLEAASNDTLVTLTHNGFKKDDNGRVTDARAFWETALENLQAVVETGWDLRITRRPMLGIVPSDLTEEDAKRLGVPVTKGMYLQDTLEGMGSAAAGLIKDDVLVSADGSPIDGFESLAVIMKSKRAGDILKVEFYRGEEKKTATITLSGRQWVNVPEDPRDFARELSRAYDEIGARIDRIIEGVDDEAASRRPAPEEWSVKEVLAHLILSERDDQHLMASIVGGNQLQGGGPNLNSRINAVIETIGTVGALRQELSRSMRETLTFIAELPADFVQHKVGYHLLGLLYLEGLAIHFRLHQMQLEAAVPVNA